MRAALQQFITAYGSQDSNTKGLDDACAAAKKALAEDPTNQETSYRENQAAVERRMILRNQQVIMTALLTFKNMDVDQLRYHIGKMQGYLGAEK